MEDLTISDQPAETISSENSSYKIYPVWLLAILLLAFALRIFRLDEQSIWWDEGISLHLAISTIADILSDRLSNIHPPLYFVLLKGWLSLAGVSTFGARYLSVTASWLQVAAVYGIALRWFSRRTAAVAVLAAALSAVSIIYGQEIRVYALLSLIYLMLLAVTRELTLPFPEVSKQRTRLWLALGLITWLGLHFHYIVLFVAGYVSAWALFVFTRQRRWGDLRRWLFVFFLVGVASLPWFLAVMTNWRSVRGEAFAGTFGTDPTPISFLLAQVWTFLLTGLAGALARPGISILAGVSAVVLFALVLVRLGQKGTRRDTAVLLAHWLIPLSSALIVWTVRSFSHPRYVSMFAPGLILLVSYVTFPPKGRLGLHLNWLSRLLSMILLLAVFLSSILGLWLYYFVPEVAKDDIRGIARFLEEEAEGGDLILIPDTDWSLPFEYQGEAAVGMPGMDDRDRMWANLAALTTDVRRTFIVDYQNGTRDWQGVLPFALNKAGSIDFETEFDGLVVQSFTLDEPISAPEIRSEQTHFGPLELTGSWVEQSGQAGAALTLALRWQLSGPINQNAQVSLRMLDDAGWPMATKDTLLVDEFGRPATQWTAGEPVTTYHVIAVPPAIPPVAYDIGLQVYNANDFELKPLDIIDDNGAPKGQTYIIGSSHVTYEQRVQEGAQEDLLLSPWNDPLVVAPGLSLLAADSETDSILPGEKLYVQLLWQATSDPMMDLRPELALLQGEKELAVNSEAPVYGGYPTHFWKSGEQVFERRGLLVPLDASGVSKVVLRLGGVEAEIGELEFKAAEHSFIQPSTDFEMAAVIDDMARIAGFNLAQTTVVDAEPIPVTLVWESLQDGLKTDYVVFTHLLAEDGHLIAQHDGRPANGSRPTTGWRAGEYISDDHEMSFVEAGYEGQAQIEVGLYDPDSGERLIFSDGSDHVILPVKLTIERP